MRAGVAGALVEADAGDEAGQVGAELDADVRTAGSPSVSLRRCRHRRAARSCRAAPTTGAPPFVTADFAQVLRPALRGVRVAAAADAVRLDGGLRASAPSRRAGTARWPTRRAGRHVDAGQRAAQALCRCVALMRADVGQRVARRCRVNALPLWQLTRSSWLVNTALPARGGGRQGSSRSAGRGWRRRCSARRRRRPARRGRPRRRPWRSPSGWLRVPVLNCGVASSARCRRRACGSGPRSPAPRRSCCSSAGSPGPCRRGRAG